MKVKCLIACLMLATTVWAGPHRYLISFHKPSAVVIVDENGKVQWKAEQNISHPQECSVTESGDILCSEYSGVVCVGLDQKIRWRFKNPKKTQNPVAFPIGDDCFLIALEGPTKLREINSKGDVLKEIQLSTTFKKVHGQIRGARKTVDGTYLVSFYREGAVREYNEKGEVVRDFGKIPKSIGAIRLPNGNTMICKGLAVQELDKSGKVVWQFNTKKNAKLKGVRPGGITLLKNGNVIMKFYSKDPKMPTLMEVSRDKKVVRTITVPGYVNAGDFKVIGANFKPTSDVVAQ